MDILTNPATGLWGKKTLQQKYPHLKPQIDNLYLQEELQLIRPSHQRFPRRATLASKLNEIWQLDLLDITPFAEANDDHRYLLTAIDVLSRQAHAVPLRRKNAASLVEGLTELFTEVQPTRASFDRGSEFVNQQVKNFLSQRGIYFFLLNPPIKGAIIERFHRTLWNLINRYQKIHETLRFIDVLPQLLDNYNNKIHSRLKMAPNEVTEDNQEQVAQHWKRLEFESLLKDTPFVPRFEVGDQVRVSLEKKPFDKETAQKWSREIFQVIRILPTIPPTYWLADQMNERIDGSFYGQELQKTVEPETYKIERIVDRRTRGRGRNRREEVLVKWLGWPDKFNTWEPAENIPLEGEGLKLEDNFKMVRGNWIGHADVTELEGGSFAALIPGLVEGATSLGGKIADAADHAGDRKLYRDEHTGRIGRKRDRNKRFADRRNDKNNFKRFDYLKREMKERGLNVSDDEIWAMVLRGD